jgi:hypothetical protein
MIPSVFPVSSNIYFQSMTGRTILSVAYGIHIKERDDPYIELAKQALDVVTEATEKGRLINLIPARMSSF